MSINEEMQSTNEELETSKEELQSVNEELSTVNNRLNAKVDELEAKRADLENLLAATDVATICLDTEMAVRWFTPAAQQVVRLRDSDRGRPLADISDDFQDGDLARRAQDVLDQLRLAQDEAVCKDGRAFLRRVAPYRADDHRIGGVVITFIEITNQKNVEKALVEAKELSEKIVNTVRESMLVLDNDLRVVSANSSFYDKFEVTRAETEGRLVYELGNNQWDIPGLRRLLEDVLPESSIFNGYEVDHEFETIGHRVMRLNARRIDRIERILLAIEDITEFRVAERQRTFLLSLTDALHTAVNSREVLQEAATRLGRFLQCEHAAYVEVDVGKNLATVLAQHSEAAHDVERNLTLSNFGPDVLASLLETGELIIHDTWDDHRVALPAYRNTFDKLGTRALAFTARRSPNGRMALLAVGYADAHKWAAEEICLLRDVAERTWSSLEAARTREELSESEQRFRMAAEAAGFGTYDYNVMQKRAIWSRELYTVSGVPETDTPNDELVHHLLHPDDREDFERIKQAALDPAGPERHELEFRIVRPDGNVCWLRDTGRTYFQGHGDARQPYRVVGTIQDITKRKKAEIELQQLNTTLEQQVGRRTAMLKLLQNVTRHANKAHTVEEAMYAALAQIAEHNGWRIGHAWRMADDNSSQMVSSGIWYETETADGAIRNLDEFKKICENHRFSPGEGLVGNVVRSGEPKWIDDIMLFDEWQRGSAEWIGLHAAIAFPVTVNGEVAAVLEFFSNRFTRREERFMEIMPDVGIQLGHVIERKRLEREIAEASESEQRRIGQDIHDGVGQELAGLRYTAQTHFDSLTQQKSPDAQTAERITTWLATVQQQLRDVIRQLVPVEVDEKGLIAALRALAERMSETDELTCTLQCDPAVRVPERGIATQLFRIAQEAVRNAVRHSRASHVMIRLEKRNGSSLTLEVVDDGVGLAPSPERTSGVGLRSMAYRAGLIGATLDIAAREEGGTRVTCTVLQGRR